MTRTKVYHCRWCDKELIGYKPCHDHEYNCALNPRKMKGGEAFEPVNVAEIAEEETTGFAPMPDDPGTGDVPAEETAEMPSPEEDPQLDAVDDLANLIDARIGFRWSQMESRLNEQFAKRDQEYGQQFKDAIASLPGIIQQSVVNYLSGQAGGGNGAGELSDVPPATPPLENVTQPVATNPPNSGINVLGMNFDWRELALEYLKAKGKGNPATGLINIFMGQNKQKTRPTDSKYFTRGMGLAQGVLRMKNIDSTAMALALKSQAEQMLKEGISPQQRDLYIGQKSLCDAFLDGLNLQKAADQVHGGEGA